MRNRFSIFLCLAGVILLGGRWLPAQEDRDPSPRTVRAARAEWRSALRSHSPDHHDPQRLEEVRARGLEETIERLQLTAEQARQYRILYWTLGAELFRNLPPSGLPDGLTNEWLAYHEARYEALESHTRKLHRRTIDLLTDRQRALYREFLEEARPNHARWLDNRRGQKPHPPSRPDDEARQRYRIQYQFYSGSVAHIERLLEILDDAIRLSHALAPSQLVEKEPREPVDSLFRSPNVVATGQISDTRLQSRLQGELHHIQQRYDLIASQLDRGEYDRAQRNIDLLRQRLPEVGDLVSQVEADGDRCEVVLIGLPSDAAMAPLAELEQMQAENLQHYDRIQADLTQINDDLYSARTEYINEVWRAMTRNLFEWHSPPAWYEVPQTFKGWYDQSKEQADKILSRKDVIENLEMLEKYLEKEMRDVLDRHKNEIMDKLNPLKERIPELDAQVQSSVSQVDWARWTPGERGK